MNIETCNLKCQTFLQKVNHVQKFKIIYYEKSYLTGLKYCSVSPKSGYVYACYAENDNKYDSNAIVVLSSKKETLGYAPKDFAPIIRQHVSSCNQNNVVVLCCCFGNVTDRSCQCYYVIVEINSHDIDSLDDSEMIAGKSILEPCGHQVDVSHIQNAQCPVCKTIIEKIK